MEFGEKMVLFSFVLLVMIEAKDFYKEYKEFETYANETITPTTVGKRLINEDYNDKYYHSSHLYIVRYNKNYMITDSDLRVFGSRTTEYTITDDFDKRGTSEYISPIDVIPIRTITDEEVITLPKAYQIIDEALMSDRNDLFPNYHEPQTFSLNENPLAVSKKYCLEKSENEEEKLYNPGELYLVYHDKNIYLCTEKASFAFSIANDGNKWTSPSFIISETEMKDSNYIKANQVVNFEDFLVTIGVYSELFEMITLKEAYQILEVGIEMIKNPFLNQMTTMSIYSSKFTEAQNLENKELIEYGLSFLDDYHTPRVALVASYYKDKLKVVYYRGNILIVENIEYDEEQDIAILSLIVCSYPREEKVYSASTDLQILSMNELLKEDLFNYYREHLLSPYDYYQALLDYIIRYGNPFDKDKKLINLEEIPAVEEELEDCLTELGLRLNLNLYYKA